MLLFIGCSTEQGVCMITMHVCLKLFRIWKMNHQNYTTHWHYGLGDGSGCDEIATDLRSFCSLYIINGNPLKYTPILKILMLVNIVKASWRGSKLYKEKEFSNSHGSLVFLYKFMLICSQLLV